MVSNTQFLEETQLEQGSREIREATEALAIQSHKNRNTSPVRLDERAAAEPAHLVRAVASRRESSQTGGPQNGQSQEIEKNLSRLHPRCYFPERQDKDLIVLHFTAGTSCASAYRTWVADSRRIATAYGVDPDGTIVEFFPPGEWAYHLGVKGTHRHDRRSIGIEIANPGPLKRDPRNPSQLNWWPKDWGTRYCDIGEEDRYVTASYRGIEHFAVMPEVQQMAVGALVRKLCEEFSIPREASAAARRGDFDLAGFANYKGVASHSNFRGDKWDVGPAFDWDYLGF